jgi:hypothetical protein
MLVYPGLSSRYCTLDIANREMILALLFHGSKKYDHHN